LATIEQRLLSGDPQQIAEIPQIVRNQVGNVTAPLGTILLNMYEAMMAGAPLDFVPLLSWSENSAASASRDTKPIYHVYSAYIARIANLVAAGARLPAPPNPLQYGTGPGGVSAGIYALHAPEIVVGQRESRGIQAGQGYYDQMGYHTYDRAGANGRGRGITLQFGDIHLARGGRQEAEEFITTVERSIKSGRLRVAVQRAAVGQV
jgi:hypothetical protein